MLQMLKTYMDAHWYREEGATAVEYGIMVALIAVVIIVVVQALGLSLQDVFRQVDTAVGGATGGEGGGGNG
jgi:pilus assembly protein Flp/PilA